MSIYEDGDAETGSASLVVPDYGKVSEGSEFGGGGNQKDFKTEVDHKPLIAVAAVLAVGYLVYSSTSTPETTDNQDANAPVGYTPPPPPASCTAQLPSVQGGYYHVDQVYGANSATLMCNYGMTVSTYGTSITCTNNFWTQSGTCTAAVVTPPPPAYRPPPPPAGGTACATPLPTLQGGHYTAYGASATLQCDYGHTMSAYGTSITCVNYRWSQTGSCTPAGGVPAVNTGGNTGDGCTSAPPSVRGGLYNFRYQGSSATLQCSAGYTPSSFGVTIHCSNNVWQPEGTCTSSLAPSPPYNPNARPPPPAGPMPPQTRGRFMAIQQAVHYDQAAALCQSHGAVGLASIHSSQEQTDAAYACSRIVGTSMTDPNVPKGCWLGLHRDPSGTRFIWEDGSATDFINWAPGEPNDYHAAAGSASSTEGEDVTEMDFRMGDIVNGIVERGGGWNDQNKQGEAGHDTINLFGNTVTTGGGAAAGSAFGAYVLCETTRPVNSGSAINTETGLHNNGFEVRQPATSPDGRYTAYQNAENWDDAHAFCTAHGKAGLASIHSASDQESAAGACQQIISNSDTTGVPHGCWIGLNQRGHTGTWAWNDGSPTNYVAWAPGEPNDYRGGAGTESSATGEEVSEMDFRTDPTNGIMGGGGWNDNHVNGQAGHGQTVNLFGSTITEGGSSTSCYGCSGTYGMYILCEATIPYGTTGTGGVINPFAPSPPYVRHDPTNSNVQGGKYLASPSPTNYADAFVYCQTQGMTLASIHSAQDQTDAYNTCRTLWHEGVSGEPSGCWIGLNSHDVTGGTNHGTFRWADNTAVDYIDWSPGEPNDWGVQSNVGAASAEGEDSVELNVDRLGAWNDQHSNGDAQHDQQENGGQHVNLFGQTVNCFGCTGTYGMWPLCQRQTPRPNIGNFVGNVFTPLTHIGSHSPTWSVPGTDQSTGNLNYNGNDYYGNGGQVAHTTLDCISSKSCAQLAQENGGWPSMRGDSMVCGESDTIGTSETLFGHTIVNGDTVGSCTGGMNSQTNGATAGGTDGSNGQRSAGWVHADSMCKDAGARLCTVRELLLDVTSGTGCQHDGELIWTFEGCMPQAGGTSFMVSTQPNPGYHVVAQGSVERGKEACPDQCGAVPDGTTCICTPRCANDQHTDTATGNSFAHRCCADVSPQTLTQQATTCAQIAGYNGELLAPPTTFGAAAGCAPVTLFGATTVPAGCSSTVHGGYVPPAPPPIQNPFAPSPPPAINPFAPTPPPPGYQAPAPPILNPFANPPPPPGGQVVTPFGPQASTCPQLSPISNIAWTVQGTQAIFQCPQGQSLMTGSSSMSVMCINGAWSPRIPFEVCEARQTGYVPPPPPPNQNPFAPPPPPVVNPFGPQTPPPPATGYACPALAPLGGPFGTAWTIQGTSAFVQCPAGQVLSSGSGSTLSAACVNGAWSPPVVYGETCITSGATNPVTNPFGPPPPPAAGCTAPVPLVQGGMYTIQFGGTSATLRCNYGFTPSAFATISCTNNFWSQSGTCAQAGGAGPPPPPVANPFAPPPPPVTNPFGPSTPPPPPNPFGGSTCPALQPVAAGYAWQIQGTQASMQCPGAATVIVNGQYLQTVQLNCVNGAWNPQPQYNWACQNNGGR